MNDTRSAREHVRPLTSLRFFAAFWVLLHHALPRGASAETLRAGIGETGWLGVSLFFVLSGFLLTVRYAPSGVLQGTRRAFWSERVARLAPTYALALAFAIPLFLRDAGVHGLSGERMLAVAASVVTLQQSWWPDLACAWNCPAWSLSVEAWFYVAFPFAVLGLGPWVMRSRARSGALLVAACAASLALFAWLPLAGTNWPLSIYPLSPTLRWPEFLAGIGLAGLAGAWSPASKRTALGLLALGVAWLAAIIVAGAALRARGLPLVPVALPAFVTIIAACWALREHAPGWLDAAPLVLLGEASYALYLFHAPTHAYLLAVVKRVAGPGLEITWGVFALYLALVLPLSILIYSAFERPARARLRLRLGLGTGHPRGG